MTSRFRLAWIVGSLALAGCGGSFNPGPLQYEESEALTRELADKTKANLAGKPKLQDGVRKGLAKQFGPNPQEIHVPPGSGLPSGGRRLANLIAVGESVEARPKQIYVLRAAEPGQPPVKERQDGGYALYRRHCLHCHGVTGAGNGPTADFLYPRPRDYRPGKFKFTSTPNGAKPTRDDLRRTIRDGLHGTSMPAFDSLMSDGEIEQVLDYAIFLSMRGETELGLIDEASIADENDPEALSDEVVDGVVKNVINKWTSVEAQVFNPPVARTPATRQSILRGRDLFLGHKSRKGNSVDCVGCHGPQALGNGVSFVAQDVFNDVVFGGDPSLQEERLQNYRKEIREQWKNSLDDWGNPLRPNNLNRGVFKGGRRPLDIYWRIAKGITGAKMPGHYPTLEADEIWDVVNFVLALPYEPKLLEGAVPANATPAKPAVAQR
ncbi:Cytochrome c [Singulisphaera sp. GP187]|uniref:c-type cytochrome n=1 Tax=Singulisphaera sp. GP187 TaxID=1882752 RepID=UPI00092A0B58|nr:c-type cytochrome [Singulisphaera sp. GP187]SIO21831.1 Cytochrome c [Singulisphaera sp. GP187]